MRHIFTLLFLLIPLHIASAGQKPIGFYSPGYSASPPGVSFGTIGEQVTEEEIDLALRKSLTTNFVWILQVGYFDHPLTSATLIGERNNIKFRKLLNHIVGVALSEEWYEQFRGNHFAIYGFPSDFPNGAELIHMWLGIQHGRLKQSMGKPVIWITNVVYSLQPVPDNTDYVAIDAYSADDEDFSWVIRRLLYAEIATHHKLIFIVRFFKVTGPKQGSDWRRYSKDPQKETVDLAVQVLKRDRYVALLPFLWESRPGADLVGLKDMPELKRYFFEQLLLHNK